MKSILIVLLAMGWPLAGLASSELDVLHTRSVVGAAGSNTFVTPVNQVLTPAGVQVQLPGLRPQGVAVSPDGKWVAVSGKTAELLLLSSSSGEIRARAALPATPREYSPEPTSDHYLQPDKDAQLSYTGLVFSPDGTRIYLSSINGTIKVFKIESDKLVALQSFSLPPADAPRRKVELPAGLALSTDGSRLYIAFNLSNQLAEMDTSTGKILRTWEVGVAPYDVALVGKKVYVSNWGGRRPDATSVTGPAGKGTLVRVDPVRHIAGEGSVSIVDLAGKGQTVEILTGLHASALAVAPDKRHVVVANAGSDTLSVIDTRSDQIVETIWARQSPVDQFGASPNALAFDGRGRTLFVCNGTQNAVGVVQFRPGKSRLQGLIPVGWFPGAIGIHPNGRTLYVANIKGQALTAGLVEGKEREHNSRQFRGSVSIVPVPSRKELAGHTSVALRNLRYPLLKNAALKPRPDQPARPVPERVGEPSVFQHVVYIIKENRTYDQVFGALPQGKGDPSLCVFGETITPNQHKMVRDFVLLDNTYCSGILSADGHQWATTGFATDYMEKSFAGFPRSYPDGMEDDDIDALAYSPAGFIWDSVLANGKTLRNYGEFAITEKRWIDPANKTAIKFSDHWRDWTNDTPALRIWSRPAVESLRPYLCTNTVGWDMDIPDVFRARQFINELKEFERRGEFPNLVIICLPNDHTSGTSPGAPTPAAQVADNDLAFGQIVEALSHSRFWKQTCIFAIEDDPQAGWDHVSGYRTTAYVISPYTKRGQVISTQYNQTSILRTIGLMLGLPPMNQMDATATPMSDCFVDVPDFAPFKALRNNVPLDQMNPEPKKAANDRLRRDALVSSRLPLDAPDRCPESTLNQIIWRAMKGPDVPYPAWAIQVSGGAEED